MIMWWLRVTQRNSISASCSFFNGVPHGSVLGPFPFIRYACVLRAVMTWHAFMALLCWWHHLILAFPRSDSHISTRVSVCLADILTRMAAHHLRVKPSQTQLLEIPPEVYHHRTTWWYMKPRWNYHSLLILRAVLSSYRVLLHNVGQIWTFQYLTAVKGLVRSLGIWNLKYCNLLCFQFLHISLHPVITKLPTLAPLVGLKTWIVINPS